MGKMTRAVRIETDSVTIQELAQLMVDNLQSDSLSGAAKKAWRAWRDGLFAGARKAGPGTSPILIAAGDAERWVENGCPTPSEIPPGDGMIRTIRVLEMAERAGETIGGWQVRHAIKAGVFPSARRAAANRRLWEVRAEEAERWIANGCPTPGEVRAEQQADDDAKRDWHLREDHMADVAGLDR